MDKIILKKLAEIAGEKAVLAKAVDIKPYSHDELSGFALRYEKNLVRARPDYVVKPQNTRQVSQILAFASKEGIPVTVRGGGTGLCGGCAPVRGGIVLSLERMNKVLDIDKDNKAAVVEAGLTLSDFYKVIEKEGLFFPPHPGDEGAEIGGIIATNAGGSRAVKYGIVRNYVRGLEVVLADGRVISLGGKFSKNSSGYSLLNLLVGSEGTLGIITKATIALRFAPAETIMLLVPFSGLSSAIGAVPAILQAGVVPMAVEFMEKDVVEYAQKRLEYKLPCKSAAAYLLIMLDSHSRDAEEPACRHIRHALDKVCHKVSGICFKNRADDVFVADSKARQKELLDFRSKFYDALKPDMLEDLDLVVPVSEIAELVKFVHTLQDKYDVWLPTYGHAADGNVHVHLMKSYKLSRTRDPADAGQVISYPERGIPLMRDKLKKLKKELYRKTKELGGMLSGEHGIGYIKVDELPEFVGETQIELMKNIKKAFDSKGILNPGKIFR